MSGLRFHRGWRMRLRQAAFALSSVKYLRRRSDPLFSARSGVELSRIGRALALRKLPELDGAYFPSPGMPHRPSRAFDHMVARGGLNLHDAGTPRKPHVGSVLMAITRRCGLGCAHCYERFNIAAQDTIPLARWKEVLRDVQRVGTAVVVLTGGEPMLRYDDLLDLLASGDKNLSDFHLHTSGLGVTPERARELRAAGLIAAAVGLDDADPGAHERLRGRGAYRRAIDALQTFRAAGVFTYTNLCLTRALIRSGRLEAYCELTRRLGVGYIQMLEPRPCGGYANAGDAVMLSEEDRRLAAAFYVRANTARRCKEWPPIYYLAYNEAPARFGCTMGGLMHLHIDSAGNVNPCVFLPVSFGNVMSDDYEAIFRRMRAACPRPIHAECPAVTLAPALNRAASRLGHWPVEHEEIRPEWEAVVSSTITR